VSRALSVYSLIACLVIGATGTDAGEGFRFDPKPVRTRLEMAAPAFGKESDGAMHKDISALMGALERGGLGDRVAAGKFGSIQSNDDLGEAMVTLWRDYRKAHPFKGEPIETAGIGDDLNKLVRIKFAGEPSSAVVSIDGVKKQKVPFSTFLSPSGKYKIEVTAEGYRDHVDPGYTPPEKGGEYPVNLAKK
jgi:hypothetical protein